MRVKYRRASAGMVLVSSVFWVVMVAHMVAQGIVAVPEGPQNVVFPATEDRNVSAAFQTSAAWQKFTGQYGNNWWVSIDKRNGRPASLAGQGIRWVGNNRMADLDSLDRMARAFLNEQSILFRINPERLVLNRDTSSNLGERGQIWYLQYDFVYNGVPVLDAQVQFSVVAGNLVQIGMDKVGEFALDTAPKLTPYKAFEIALRGVDRWMFSVEEILDPGTLYILPLASEGRNASDDPLSTRNYAGRAGEGYDYRLIYQTSFRLFNDERTFVGRVDAHTGELLDVYDDNRYGQVSGGVYPRTLEDENEIVLPFPFVSVMNNGAKVTDLGGYYDYSGGQARVVLDGKYFKISDRCGAISATSTTDPGDIDLGAGNDTDCNRDPGSGTTRAGRNTFHSLNNARQLAKKYLSNHPRAGRWLESKMTANVNLNRTCNAFYSGSVNFFRSGGGCNNTGEILDVMYHEWGHGLDANTNGAGNGAKGEGVADLNAMFHIHDHCMAPGFRQTPRPVEGSSALCSLEACPTSIRELACPVSLSTLRQVCTRAEVHCDSHVLSGAVWDLSQLLLKRYGENEGWHVAERLYFLAMPTLRTYIPTSNGNAYTAFLTAADDDGDLSNGVPDGDLIYQAFNNREIAREEAPNFTAVCVTPPVTPSVAATAGNRRVTLSWNAVPGASSYQIVRRVQGSSLAFLPLEDAVTGTQYTDTQVSNGVLYDYIVTATVNDCTSRYADHVSATPSGS